MPSVIGQPLDALDSPQLLVDLDIVDANLRRMFSACRERPVKVRVHFKSLKCAGLARYIAAAGADGFLCAKLNEAEVLADAGLTDIFIANQIVGPIKLKRLAELAKRAQVRVCVDDAENVEQMGRAARTAGATVGVLIEVDIGMGRCGVEPGEPALALARQIHGSPGLRFVGLQGYDGHLQLMADATERKARCFASLEKLIATRRLIEKAGIPVEVVTGAGTGTWEFVSGYEGVTEIQPGSFVLMDCAYHTVPAGVRLLAVDPGDGHQLPAGTLHPRRRQQGNLARLRHAGHQGAAGRQGAEAVRGACDGGGGGRPRARGRPAGSDPGPLLRDDEPAPNVCGRTRRQGRGVVADRGERPL
jgi:hypothetical protein